MSHWDTANDLLKSTNKYKPKFERLIKLKPSERSGVVDQPSAARRIKAQQELNVYKDKTSPTGHSTKWDVLGPTKPSGKKRTKVTLTGPTLHKPLPKRVADTETSRRSRKKLIAVPKDRENLRRFLNSRPIAIGPDGTRSRNIGEQLNKLANKYGWRALRAFLKDRKRAATERRHKAYSLFMYSKPPRRTLLESGGFLRKYARRRGRISRSHYKPKRGSHRYFSSRDFRRIKSLLKRYPAYTSGLPFRKSWGEASTLLKAVIRRPSQSQQQLGTHLKPSSGSGKSRFMLPHEKAQMNWVKKNASYVRDKIKDSIRSGPMSSNDPSELKIWIKDVDELPLKELLIQGKKYLPRGLRQ